MSVSLIVPWLAGCPYRERALEWVRPLYDLPLELAPGPQPWVKALAVMPAIARSSADVVVVADADVWAEGLPEAIAAVEAGAPWATPHRGVFRLSEEGTDRLLTSRIDVEDRWLEQRVYRGTEGGGIVVARRETLLDVPLDPRFIGWGQEDECWGLALRSLVGPPSRGKGRLVHLYHPPQKRMDRKRGSPESWALRRRYVHARDPEMMRALIEEIDDSAWADKS